VDDAELKIGELAERTGLTVRTLRHYDEIGLLQPSARTGAGHRLYSGEDVRRLYRIVALKHLGMPLAEISDLLDRAGADPRPIVRKHLERLEQLLALQGRLRDRLNVILDELEGTQQPSADDFIEALEVMAQMDKYYTPEQLAQLEERRREMGDEAIQKSQQDWADLIAEAEAERAKGTDPSDPKVQAIAARWKALIEAFTGGDPGISSSLQKMYQDQGPEKASRGMVNSELMAWIHGAMHD
jgi:DNA-binding transcriptional MerR regulator